MSYPNQGRKLQPGKGQKLTSLAIYINQQTLIDRTADAIQRDFGGLANANKLLAREIDSNPSTIKNLRKRNNLPSLLTAVKLARKSPTFRAFLAEAIGVNHPNDQSEKIRQAMQLLAEVSTQGELDEVDSH